MKKFYTLSTAFFTLLLSLNANAQDVAIIGMNHVTPDGFAFVALGDIANSTVIYFTEDEYNNTTDLFTSGEAVVKFTFTSSISLGDVVFVKEVSSDAFTVTCSGGGSCGTAIELDSMNNLFNLGTSGDELYAYSDTDDDPTNGVTEIFAVMLARAGTIPSGEDPTVDHPNAIVVDGFASGTPDRTEFNASRDLVDKAQLEDPSNYTNGSVNADLNLNAFTNLQVTLGANDPILNNDSVAVFPNPVSSYLYVNSALSLDRITLYDMLGKVVLETRDTESIGLQGLNRGMYFLKLESGNQSLIQKIIKR